MKLKASDVLRLSGAVEIMPWDIDCSKDVPITKQEFKDECDVNLIMKRCIETGSPLPLYQTVSPVFADVSEFGDYRSVLHRLRAAEDAFMSMPAPVRARFDNDPAKLVDFLSVESNREEAIRLGLVEPPKADPSKPVIYETTGPRPVVEASKPIVEAVPK